MGYFGRCVVTGGRGFLGPYIVDALRAAKNHVTFVSREQALEGNYDLLVHAAPVSLEPFLGRARRGIVLSSGAVTTRGSDYLQGYADDKRTLESDARANGLQIARIFSVIGPGMERHPHFAATQFFAQAKAGGPLIVKDGAVRSYLYPSDVASALLTILASGDREPYDVGGEEIMSVAQLGQRIATAAGVACHMAEPLPSDAYLPDLTRLHGLGWKQTITTNEMIRECLGLEV